jgi:hypothetical protein
MKIFRLFVAFTLICFALSPSANAVSPPPDGAYPNFTTAEGEKALQSLTTGAGNTALGAFSLFANTTGSFNTAVGAGALDLNTGDENTAVGVAALLLNTGTQNTAVGVDALGLNSTGFENTADGAFALYNNTTGPLNTATGFNALLSNTDGDHNTAMGANALSSNIDGGVNTAIGGNALANNTASANTAIGFDALLSNTGGTSNTATGVDALEFNTTGNGNIAIGASAGIDLTTGDNNIDIFDPGLADESNTIRVGTEGTQAATYIAGIFGATAPSGTAVFINFNGQLGTNTSSRRFKEEITPMNQVSEALYSLNPVSFRYKKEIDPARIRQLGLVAEDVEKVNPDLIVRDKEGKPYSVRYDQVNAMLLNEFLKEHRKVEQQRKDFEAALARQQKQIEALTAGLQRVSAQLELSKAAPQTVLNNQ